MSNLPLYRRPRVTRSRPHQSHVSFRNISLLLSQAQGIQNQHLNLPSKRTYCSPTYLVGSTWFQSPRAFQRTSRGPMVTRACQEAAASVSRVTCSSTSCTAAILREGFAPLEDSSTGTHCCILPRSAAVPIPQGVGHFDPDSRNKFGLRTGCSGGHI